MEKKKILVVEDDAFLRETLARLLQKAGYEVNEAESGEEAVGLMEEGTALVVLDVLLPGMSGFETCRKIREKSYVPILYLSALTAEQKRVEGLEAGGDDYLGKPFSYEELKARVRALIRRHSDYDRGAGISRQEEEGKWLEYGPFKIQRDYNIVYLRGEKTHLTGTEYRILRYLMQHPGEVCNTADIHNAVWGEPGGMMQSTSITVHIRNLRNKIEEDPAQPKLLLTVWGQGYRLLTGLQREIVESD